MRFLLCLVAIIFPNFLKIIFYKKLGWQIGKNVKIGLSYIDCEHCVIKDNVRIGNFNIIRRLQYLEVGNNSIIKNFNQFFYSGRIENRQDWCGKVLIKDNVKFMSHHFIDAEGSVLIKNKTTVAGRNTHIWSHTFAPQENGLKIIRLKIIIGENVYLGSRSNVLNSIPNKSIVGLGSIVNKYFPEEKKYRLLIAGNPAKIKKRYPITIE